MMDERLKVVLDTNVLIAAAPEWSPYRIIIDALLNQEYKLFITTEILLEYEEKLFEFYNSDASELIISALSLLPNVNKQDIFFNFTIIKDLDDNKFLDCAFAANVHYLVSDDKDFNVLKEISFPKINVIKTKEFAYLLQSK